MKITIGAALVVVAQFLLEPAAHAAESAPGNRPNNLIDALPPDHWLDIPNSHLSSVVYNGPLAAEIHGATGPRSIMIAWGGGAYDTKRDRLVVWGGGHTDYAGNEVYAFAIDDLKWSRLTDPSPIAHYDGSGIYPDGSPASHHSYNHLAYVPDPVDRLFEQGGARYINGWTDRYTWLFDFTSKKWERKADAPTSAYGDIVACDPGTGHVWMEVAGTHGYLLEYDPAADSWTAHGSQFSKSVGDNATGAIDPAGHQLVAVGGKTIHVWKLSPSPLIAFSTPTTSGDSPVQAANSPGFVWYPPANQFVGWAGGADLYSLDPTTWAWTKHPPTPDNKVTPPPPAENGTFGRFQYVPSKNVFILVNDINQDVYVYKPGFGAAPSSSGH